MRRESSRNAYLESQICSQLDSSWVKLTKNFPYLGAKVAGNRGTPVLVIKDTESVHAKIEIKPFPNLERPR